MAPDLLRLRDEILALTVADLGELNRLLLEGGAGPALGTREPRRPTPPAPSAPLSVDAEDRSVRGRTL